jgi:protease IV
MKFLRNLLAVIVGLFIFSFLMFLIFAGLIAASSSEKGVKVEDNSVLEIVLSGNVTEQEADDPFADIDFPSNSPKEIGLKEMKEAIRHAKDDPKIKGIFLEPKLFQAGYASLGELRDVLADFKSSGKFIVAYSEMYTEKGYYLASVANKIFLTKDYGMLEFNGLNAQEIFIKGLLDKLGVEPEIFRVGEYKSAVEPLIRKDMSDDNRKQLNSFVNSIYSKVAEGVSEARNIPFDQVMHISDSMLVRTPEDAMHYGLITGVDYYGAVVDTVKSLAGTGSDKSLNKISYRRYIKSIEPGDYEADRIAVIVASGDIVSGKGDNNSIGSDKFSEEIRKAARNDKVKAIVLRVNSPGGSAMASDIIWNEIIQAKKKKPVIASMSDVAASGGYYISMGCDSIVASPTTITGSIGVFSILFNAKEFLNDKLGITTDNVNTGHFSDLFTVTRPLTAYEKKILQDQTDYVYDIFTSKAAEGRKMPVDDLKKIAQGRVWSGEEALKIGLIDKFGNLDDAINMAAAKAGVAKYRVVYYPERKSFIDQILSELSGDMNESYLKAKLGSYYSLYKDINHVTEYQGIQARMPYDLNIE